MKVDAGEALPEALHARVGRVLVVAVETGARRRVILPVRAVALKAVRRDCSAGQAVGTARRAGADAGVEVAARAVAGGRAIDSVRSGRRTGRAGGRARHAGQAPAAAFCDCERKRVCKR